MHSQLTHHGVVALRICVWALHIRGLVTIHIDANEIKLWHREILSVHPMRLLFL